MTTPESICLTTSRTRQMRLLWRCALPALLGLLVLSPPANGEDSPVTITGGLQEDGSYRWVVTNHSPSQVVSVEFPHYQADMFYPAPGWKSKSTYLVNVGVPDLPGNCRAWVESPRNGIPQKGNATFGMRVRQLEASKGVGVVKVGFADGTTTEVAGVEVPTTPGFIERFGVLIVFGVFFALVVIIAARRRRKKAAAQPQ